MNSHRGWEGCVYFEAGRGRPWSFCIFNGEDRDGRGCAFTLPFLAPQRRERAVDRTLAGEEKSADGPQQRLTGKNVPAAVLQPSCPGLQKPREVADNVWGLDFFRPLNLLLED